MGKLRTEPQGPLLASVIERIDPRVPVCLVGHSFGGPVVLAAPIGWAAALRHAYGNPVHPGTRADRHPRRAAAPAVEELVSFWAIATIMLLTAVESLVLAYNPAAILR